MLTQLQIIDEAEADFSQIYLVAEFENLLPGFMYLFRIRGKNVAGDGPWSDPTYSTFTKPDIPHAPNPPRIQKATLRTILFTWDPPDDGGSAITGYTVLLKNSGRRIDLPRTSVSYLWEGLFPGRSYFMKVCARNEVGDSSFSEYNAEEDSRTVIDVPETPKNPLAVRGDWNLLTLQMRVPYNNGAEITMMEVQQRSISPFHIGDWEQANSAPTKRLPQDVTVLDQVDTEAQQRAMEEAVARLELLKASAGFNPYALDKKKIENEINEIILSQVTITFVILHTDDDYYHYCGCLCVHA